MAQKLFLENKSDIDLYNSFLKGDKESFNEIIKRYRKILINFIWGYVKNLETAEDLAQDTFLYVYINKKEYDFKYTFKTYIFTIAKCRAINWIKREKRNIKFDEKYILPEEYQIEENLIKEENNESVRIAISKLKQEYRTVIYLKDFQEMQYKEICKILNKTMPQVKVLIYRARKALAKIMKKEDFI